MQFLNQIKIPRLKISLFGILAGQIVELQQAVGPPPPARQVFAHQLPVALANRCIAFVRRDKCTRFIRLFEKRWHKTQTG